MYSILLTPLSGSDNNTMLRVLVDGSILFERDLTPEEIGLLIRGQKLEFYSKPPLNNKKCIRVGYDLHECPCKKCIDVDIQREAKISRAKENIAETLKEFLNYEMLEELEGQPNNYVEITYEQAKEFLTSNGLM